MPDSRLTRINTAMDAAITAQEGGDFRTALTQVRTAWMLIVSLPNSMFDNEQLLWDREGVAKLMAELQKLANSQPAASDGTTSRAIIRPVPVTYTRETCLDYDC